METHRVELTTEEYAALNARYPEQFGSALADTRAEAIVRIHLQRRSPRCSFTVPDAGADVKVVFADGAPPLLLVVKGAASTGGAWPQLSVASRQTYRLLVERAVPVYRVSDVFSTRPSIDVLMYGTDFLLEEEPTWVLKPCGPTALVEPTTVAEEAHLGKYEGLRSFLERKQEDYVTLRFVDAADELGFSLPRASFTDPAFWANETDTTNRPWARAWQEAGYEVDSTRLSDIDGWVHFRRRS